MSTIVQDQERSILLIKSKLVGRAKMNLDL